MTGNCQPVVFTPSANFGTHIYSYKWDFGDKTDPPENTSSKPTHVYVDSTATPFTYNVTLTVTDSKKNKCTVTKAISVQPTPFILQDTTYNLTYPFVHCIVEGDECDLDVLNKSPFKNSHYNIDWGDGTQFDSTEFKDLLKHVYPTSKQYQITATAPTGCVSYSFFCGSNPAGGIGCPANRLACAGIQLDFPVDAKTLQNPPGTTYRISFMDGSKDLVYEQENLPAVISHVYKGNTACIPLKTEMMATNPCGFTQSICYPISVSTIPNPDIGFVKNYQYDCANQTQYTFKNATSPCCIKIDGSKDNAVKLKWTVTPSSYKILKGKLDSAQVTLVFLNRDCYRVNLHVNYQNQNCAKCGDTNTFKDICLDTLPIAKATPSVLNNFSDCRLPLKVSFTNSSINAKSYVWEVTPKTTNAFWSVGYANNTNKNSANPVIQFNLPDTFNVKLYAFNNCGASTYSIQIITVSPPVIKIEKPLSFCGPDSFKLHIDENSIVFNNVNFFTTYSWKVTPDIGINTTVSNEKYPDFIFNSQHLKQYMLTFAVDNHNGCPPVKDSTLMIFTDKPELQVSSVSSSICSGDSTKLSVKDISVNNGQNLIYKWYQSDTLGGLRDTAGANVKVVPKKTTTYTVKGYIRNDTLCRDIKSNTINVIPPPAVKINPSDTTICEGESVTLYATGGVKYTWYPSGSNSASLTLKPASTSVYKVVGEDAIGCKGTATAIVKVVSLPRVSFNNKSIEFINKPVSFNNTSANVSKFLWDFGDNTNSNDTFPTHIYSIPGTYNVSLTGQSDTGCYNTAKGKIKIIKTIPFVLKSDSGCTPFTANFINNSVDPDLKYYWDFGYNGLKSTFPNPGPVTYQTNNLSAVYTVTLYLIYDSDTIKYSAKVRIFNKPKPNFTIDPRCGCPILTVTITNYSQSALPYSCKWDFGNGKTLYEAPTTPHLPYHKVSYSGIPADSTYYAIVLADSNKCGITNYKDSVTVYPNNIIVDFSADKLSVCAGDIIRFTNKSKFYNNLFWDFGDSSKSSEINPSHRYDKPGVYLVKLTAYNQCIACGGATTVGSSSFSMQVTVTKLPEFDFSFDSFRLCRGEPIQFNCIYKEPLSDIQWDFGDPQSGVQNFSNSLNPSHRFTRSGDFLVKLIAKSVSANPCVDTVIKPVSIYQKPVAALKDSNFCQYDEGQFINVSTDYDRSFWFFGDGGFSNETNPKHKYKNPGNYQVKLVVSNNSGCSDSAYSYLSVYPLPEADFNFVVSNNEAENKLSVFFVNKSSDTCDYKWDLGDGTNSEDKNLHHVYNEITSYVVNLIVTNIYNCSDTIEKVINPEPPQYYFWVPNAFTPGTSTLNNTFSPVITHFSYYHIKIFNRWGEMLYETFDYTKPWDGSFNGKPCNDGLYVYVIQVRDAYPSPKTHTYNGYVVLLRKK